MAGEDHNIETPPPNNYTSGQVRLPTFWAQAPAMWFAQSECLFQLQGVTCQVKRYCYVVASLTLESMRRVSDLVEQRPDEDEVIKARLLSALKLTDYQRADKLFELPGLGARKPSELMSQMLEICPRGEEKSHLFACLFLRRLQREIRVLLTKVDHKDPKALAEQADKLWALHAHDSVVATVQDKPAINALKQQSRDKSGGGDKKKKSWTRKKEKSDGQGPSLTARLESGLCHAHWVYGESAATCHKPCTWQGNGKAGGNKCDFSRQSSLPPRSAVRPAFPGGHRSYILGFPSPVFGSTFWTCSHRSWWPGHLYLG
jgi:hypothetical protein